MHIFIAILVGTLSFAAFLWVRWREVAKVNRSNYTIHGYVHSSAKSAKPTFRKVARTQTWIMVGMVGAM